MPSLIRRLFVIVLSSIILLSPVTQSYAIEDAILAIVNDEIITLKDLRDYVRGVYVALVAEGQDKEVIDKVMLDLEINGINKLIEDKLMLSKANEVGLIVNDKVIDKKLDDIRSRYKSEQDFIEALVKNGASITDVRSKIHDQLKIQYVVDHQVRTKIYINPNEVTQYYQNNVEQFQEKERIFVESIYIPFEGNRDAAMKQANIALELIQNGEDFITIARDYSKAPSIGMLERGTLQAEIEKEVFHLDINTPSSLIEVDTGVYIFLVTEKTPAKLAELHTVKDLITNHLSEMKFQERFLAWIAKLKKNAYIELKQ